MAYERPRAGVSRRRFLVGSGLVAGGVAAGAVLGPAAPAAAAPLGDAVRVTPRAEAVRGGWYGPNRAPLAPVPFLRLPPGSVTPRGWVRGQLDLQAAGLNGRLPEISDYLDLSTSGWVDPSRGGWEELPYWLRGFSELGLVTGDDRVRQLAGRWIDGILATARPDGFFGPEQLRTSLEGGPDFWPSMPLLDAFRTHEEATGDDRVVPLLTGFFGYMSRQQDAVFGRSWGSFRWADDIDSILWLYNRTGDGWLLDLIERIHLNSADYVSGIPNWHNVNIAQGIREPAEYGLLAGDQRFEQATYRDYDTVMGRYGQFAGGGFAGDENARRGFGDPRQGFETCGIVELMRTCELLTRITGDPVWTDRCEELAFDSLPAALDPAQKVVHYVTSANAVTLENVGKFPQYDNGFPMEAFRPGIRRYRCCPHNYGQGWPYFAEEMWLATAGNGLCASMYGPSEVTAKVGAAGSTVTVVEDTDYPFGETVTLRLAVPGQPDGVAFPLWLRIPGWCRGATVAVDGRSVAVRPDPGRYVVLDRTWRDRDTVTLRLPMAVTARTWQRNVDSVTVRRGPLAYSLAIGERYDAGTGGDGDPVDPEWPMYEVRPTTPWNYGLDLDPARIARSVEVRTRSGPVPANPFTRGTVPVELTAPARRLPGWTTDEDDMVRHLQPSPARSVEPVERVTLVPMGAARLRITSFPVVGQGGAGHEWAVPSASHVFDGDLLDAVNDGLEPRISFEQDMPRLTFWDHLGTTEWVQYDYAQPVGLSSSSVYWFDDTGQGRCRTPLSWRLSYRQGDTWVPVGNPSVYSTYADAWNTVSFDPVRTTAVRLEVRLRPTWSAGVLEWRVDQT